MSISGKTHERARSSSRPVFHFITNRAQPGGHPLRRVMRQAMAAGVDFIQVREKDLCDRSLFDLVCGAVSLARGTGCRILVNGRADLALAAGAHGVHLPSAGLRACDLVSRMPPQFLVGVSTHSLEEARRAENDGAHYILLGPVFRTASKARYGNPIGLDTVEKVCRAVAIPVIALGGIDWGSVPAVLRSGAAGVAGITMFQANGRFARRAIAACKGEAAGERW